MGYILVTGGFGFIGHNLIKYLNDRGYIKIVVVDSLGKRLKWNYLGEIEFYDFINYRGGLEKVFNKLQNYNFDVIFHIGANTDVSETNIEKMLYLNYEFSKMYFKIAQENNSDFIYASSSAVYGNINEQIIGNENPLNPYALSKYLFDKYMNNFFQGSSFQIVGFRFFNVYGLGEFHKGKNASIPYRFFEMAKRTGKIKLFENGNRIFRDYIKVEDVVSVVFKSWKNLENGLYNLGSGSNISHYEIAYMIVKEIGGEITYIPFPESLRDKFQFYTKAQNIEFLGKLGIRAKPPLEGIKEYIYELKKYFT